jgi:hypothetical protein
MALNNEKIAVHAPMPSASESTAVNVNPGDFESWRKAVLKSWNMRKEVVGFRFQSF